MDIYTVPVSVTAARAASLPLGKRRYDYSMFQDGDRAWRRVLDPGYVAIVRGLITVVVRGHDEHDAVRRIAEQIVIPLDEPPACAPGGLHVQLGKGWRAETIARADDDSFAYVPASARVWASWLRLAFLTPVPPATDTGCGPPRW